MAPAVPATDAGEEAGSWATEPTAAERWLLAYRYLDAYRRRDARQMALFVAATDPQHLLDGMTWAATALVDSVAALRDVAPHTVNASLIEHALRDVHPDADAA